MANKKIPVNPGDHPAKSAKRSALKETFKKAKHDPAVKAALKIEKQPVNMDDLSHLQNTSEIGTSGGDQRASETELKQAGETGQ